MELRKLSILVSVGFLISCKIDAKKINKRSDQPQGSEAPSTTSEGGGEPLPDLDPNAPFNLVPKPSLNLRDKMANLTHNAAFNLTTTPYGSTQQPPASTPLPAWQNSTKDFYLGINKNEMGNRWFLVAQTKQLYPTEFLGGPAITLGTRVVSFKVQNDRIFIFDVSGRYGSSSVINPTVLVESYPLISSTDLPPGTYNKNFIYFDPSLGESKFGPLQDILGAYSGGLVAFETDLRFLANYKALSDGIYYEMVFSGVSNVNVGSTVDTNPNRLIGTLGLSIRRYKETTGFVKSDVTDFSHDFYFPAWDAFKNPAAGDVTHPVAKWRDLKNGMTPIPFVISSGIKTTQNKYPQYDIIGAVKKGFEAWNTALGFQVFNVSIAPTGASWAADDTNMLLWNTTYNLDWAYADWRVNPVSGEIRGASIYMEDWWVDQAATAYVYSSSSSQSQSPMPKSLSKVSKKTAAFSWGSMKPINLCSMPQDQLQQQNGKRAIASALRPPFNEKTFVENYITHVVAHEVGHILGLRHNFLGSTYSDTQSSSIMDYLPDSWSGTQPTPGVYDMDAVKYLYGLAPSEPPQAFCTDENINTDPRCRIFDYGRNSLTLHMIPDLTFLKQIYLQKPVPYLKDFIVPFSQDVLDFFQGGDPVVQLQAWEGLMQDIKATASASSKNTAIDELTQWILETAFKEKQTYSAFSMRFIEKPLISLGASSVVAKDLCDIANNVDLIRKVPSRILAIDALKRMQNNAGLQALNTLKTELSAKANNLAGPLQLEEKDLLYRVEKHLTPYYD